MKPESLLIVLLFPAFALAQAPGNRESYNSGARTFVPARTQAYDLSTAFASRHHTLLLPPETPVLGSPPAALQGAAASETPAELLPLRRHVFEPFYGPLATLLAAGDLTEDRRRSLEAYTAAREAALAELHAKLDETRPADATRSAGELAAFAAQQAPRLAELDRTAEQLHATFMRDAAVLQGIEWQNLRQVKLARDVQPGSVADEWNLVIVAAFFNEGLSADQRLLLREMIQELGRSLRSAPGGTARAFSPFTARVDLPAGLPAALEQKLTAYDRAKSALKRELRDMLYAHDLEFWTAQRTEALRGLAAKQAAAFAELERLAEDIRRDLAVQSGTARSTTAGLPAEVSRRISAYLVAKAAWQRAMVQKLADLRGRHPAATVEFAGLEDRPRIEVGGAGRLPAAESASLADFNRTQQEAFAALGREKDALNLQLARLAQEQAGGTQARTVDQLLAEFGAALGRLDLRLRYRDYETAVLEPGLSPAQRRLLFGAALEQLELPLVAPSS